MRDFLTEVASARGAQVGLNHLGWEMESEAQLVEAYQRLRTAGISAQRPSDHLISHSIYIADPDGIYHEFYADVIEDWRQIFNLDHDDLVTSAWDPLAKPPSTEKYYPVDPPLRRVKAAPLQPTRITGATLATRHYPVMRDFLTEVAGLKVLEEIASGSRRTVFTGTTNQPDLTLMEVGQGDPLGLRMFSFQLQADCDLAECAANLAQADGPKPRLVNDPTRQAIVLSDPAICTFPSRPNRASPFEISINPISWWVLPLEWKPARIAASIRTSSIPQTFS
jgi:catechol 2,3-dioxygenase